MIVPIVSVLLGSYALVAAGGAYVGVRVLTQGGRRIRPHEIAILVVELPLWPLSLAIAAGMVLLEDTKR